MLCNSYTGSHCHVCFMQGSDLTDPWLTLTYHAICLIRNCTTEKIWPVAQQRQKMKGFSTVQREMNSWRALAWLLTDQSTGLSQCLTGPGQSLLLNPGVLMSGEKRRAALCELHYSQGQNEEESRVKESDWKRKKWSERKTGKHMRKRGDQKEREKGTKADRRKEKQQLYEDIEQNAKSRSKRAPWCMEAFDWIQSLSNLNEHHFTILALPLIIHSAFVQRQLSSDNCSPQRFPHAPSQNIREYQGILLPGINAPNHLARFRSRIHPSFSWTR